jgi:Fe-S oxidoreductase
MSLMKRVFAPGCALVLTKPDVARRLRDHLEAKLGGIAEHLICCRHEPGLERGTQVINVCPGCDKRFRALYEGISTVSVWEILADDASFPWPDYGGTRMAVLDACPTRDQERVHEAVRAVLRRMNIVPVEPASTRTKSICCGDSFFGEIPVERVKEQMARRAADMPVEDVAVYCVSCVKAIHIGGKRPRHLADLIFGEATLPLTFEPEEWHRELDAYIDAH